MPTATKKRCPMCGKEKSLSDYYHNSTKNDKHGGICKTCQLEVNKKNK